MSRIKKHIKKIPLLLIVVVIIFAYFIFIQPSRAFDESILDAENIYAHIEELSSPEYNGRMTGSEGGNKAVEYVRAYFEQIGIEPAGNENTYLQSFEVMVPEVLGEPTFNIDSDIDYKMYEDYIVFPTESFDYEGDMVLAGAYYKHLDPEYIKDNIIIIDTGVLSQQNIDFVYENGGKGLLVCVDNETYGGPELLELQKSFLANGKTEYPIMVGYISQGFYRALSRNYEAQTLGDSSRPMQLIENVTISVDFEYPIAETANIIGRIQGKANEGTLYITANLDGLGKGYDGKYFPGAVSTASSVAILLETARVLSQQDNLPYETVVFVAFTGQQQGLSGSDYYLANPLLPLEKSSVIHMQYLGVEAREGLLILSDFVVSKILRSDIANLTQDASIIHQQYNISFSVARSFASKKVPSVVLIDGAEYIDSYNDTIDNISINSLENASISLLSFIKRDIYKDVRFDYLNISDKIIIFILFLGLLIIYLMDRLYKNNPNRQIGKYTIEHIYHLKSVKILKKTFGTILTIILSVFLLAFITNIHADTTIQKINGRTMTNFSGYLVLKQSITFIQSLFNVNTYTSGSIKEIVDIIYTSSFRSILFLSASLLLSTVFGIAKGMIDGYRTRKNNLSSMGTLAAYSIPDVLIVLLMLLLYVYISNNLPGLKEALPLKEVILPLISLSIIPSIYITRITFITVQDELKKEYVKNAKAQGQSRVRIFASEILPLAVFKTMDTMPAIMTMLLSNMIIVEYLFGYYGIVHYLLYFYNTGNTYNFVILAMTLGLIFILFTWSIQSLSRIINPMKRRGVV